MKKVFILILSFFYFHSFSNETGVYATVDTSQILIGDQVNYTITCIQNNKLNVVFPGFTDTIITGIEIVESSPLDTVKDANDQLTIEKKYLITSFDTGAYMLPVGPFILDNDTIYGKSIFLSVNTMEVDTAKSSIKPIKLPYKQGYTFDEILPWLLIGLLILLLAGGGIFAYFYFKKKKDTSTVKYIPKEPAEIIAYRSLDELKMEQLWQKEQYKAYYSKLTEILRMYLEHKFKINAMEQTSDEIIFEIENLGIITMNCIIELKQILQTADFVKFAKLIPNAEENVNSYDLAVKFIDRTKHLRSSLNAPESETTVNTNNVLAKDQAVEPKNTIE